MNKQQRSYSLLDQTLLARASPLPSLDHSALGAGQNTNGQDRLQFINDLQAWLAVQEGVLDGLQGEARTRRINGVLSVVEQVTIAHQQGEEVDISRLPMAPVADRAPSARLVMPGLSAALLPFTSAAQVQSEGFLVASLFGNTGSPRKTPRGSTEDAAATAQAASRASGTAGKAVTRLAAQVMALKLKLPGEQRLFSVKKYGDSESVVKILQHCVQVGIKSPDQVAYILATAWLESRLGTWMTESGWLSEKSAERYAERSYGPGGRTPARARRMGNTEPGDGGRYMGRGYVQLTWKSNYARMSKVLMDSGFTYTQDGVTYGNGKNGTTPIDLVKNYRHVNRNKDLAARILVLGMDGGHYVNNGKGLDSYIPENGKATRANFESARKIVNGSDKKRLIADNALVIAGILRRDDAWSKASADQRKTSSR